MKDFFAENWFCPMLWSLYALDGLSDWTVDVGMPEPVSYLLFCLLIIPVLAWIPIGLVLNVIVGIGAFVYAVGYSLVWLTASLVKQLT